MRIIDRYLLRQFLQVFAICFLSLTGIYVVFDAFTHLEAFLRCGKGLQLLKVIGVYYAVHSTFFFDQCSNLLVLMAAMFTVAWIQRHNEMTALMAAGVSRRRIVTPVLVAASAIILLAAANRELLIPRFQEQLAQQPCDLSSHSVQAVLPQRDLLTDVLISAHGGARRETHREPGFPAPAGLSDYGKHWSAVYAYYEPPAAGRPGGYLLDGVLKPKNLPQKPSLRWAGKPVLITPRDCPDWLEARPGLRHQRRNLRPADRGRQDAAGLRLHGGADPHPAEPQLRFRRRRPRYDPRADRAAAVGPHVALLGTAADRHPRAPQRVHGDRAVHGGGGGADVAGDGLLGVGPGAA